MFAKRLRTVFAWTENNSALSCLLLLLISSLFFSWIQWTSSFADPDSFYHVKIATMMAEQGIIHDFPYLQFTTLKQHYIDHHFLYHVYLIPFVKIFYPPVGAKIAHVILDCLLVLVFYWLLKKIKIRGAFWFTLLLFYCDGFMFRMSLIKAQPISVIIIFLSIYFILYKKRWPLFILSFLYVWFYGGWFLIGIVVGLYSLMGAFDVALLSLPSFPVLWRDRLVYGKQFFISFIKELFLWKHIQLWLIVVAGLILGIIINPYFPTNLSFYWEQIVEIGFRNFQGKIGVGSEWYPYDAFQLLGYAAIPLFLYMIGLVVFIVHYRRIDRRTKFLWMLASFFIIATIRARRNIEYMSPFLVLFFASLFSYGLENQEIKKDFMLIKSAAKEWMFSDPQLKHYFQVLVVGCVFVVAIGVPFKIKTSIGDRIHFNYLAAPSQYIADHSQKGDIVFNGGWDYFPELFFHNNKNNYIVGLDTTFMYLYSPDLYWQWADVCSGKRKEEMYSIIKKTFNASYVIVKIDQKEFIKNLSSNFNFVKVYSDKETIIYKVL